MWYLKEIPRCLRGFPAADCSVETFFWGELLVSCSSCDALRRDTRKKKVEWAVGGQPFSLSLRTHRRAESGFVGGLKRSKRSRELSMYTPRITSLWRREEHHYLRTWQTEGVTCVGTVYEDAEEHRSFTQPSFITPCPRHFITRVYTK